MDITLVEIPEVPPTKRPTLFQHDSNICAPINDLSHVWTYALNPPQWIDRIIDLVPRSNCVIKNVTSDCHVEEGNFLARERLQRDSVPRTLVCHDMKGGYLEDKFVAPVNIGNAYTFFRWSHIDVFVYFSHHLITIPPLSWINVAHGNGVKILGTFITEFNPGKEICTQIFIDVKTVHKFAHTLVDIAVLFKLDGWLLNIENVVESPELLKEFVRYLTEQIHLQNPDSLIIWYDSLTDDGQLKWQNELNELNRCFFDVCDGIFLNYTWKEANLANTVRAAQHRILDVYVGVDVFGRNFFGGGCFNTHLAVAQIRKYNLSMAIFAQGWTHESLNPLPKDTLLERFFKRDNAFWRSLWPYLYTHPVSTRFHTFFYTGTDQVWFKLSRQQLQLSRFLHAIDSHEQTTEGDQPSETCSCLQLRIADGLTPCLITKNNLDHEKRYIHHLLSCDIKLNGNVIIYTFTKKIEEICSDELSLILLTRNVNGRLKKIICHSIPKLELENTLSVLEVNPSSDKNIINMVLFRSDVPAQCRLRCFIFAIENSTIIEIGGQIANGHCVCLYGIGVRTAAILDDDKSFLI